MKRFAVCAVLSVTSFASFAHAQEMALDRFGRDLGIAE